MPLPLAGNSVIRTTRVTEWGRSIVPVTWADQQDDRPMWQEGTLDGYHEGLSAQGIHGFGEDRDLGFQPVAGVD